MARTKYCAIPLSMSGRVLTTRWHDNDVFGHINNTLYYNWLDTAVCG